MVTGEHSGIENPNMPAALAGAGVTTFATDASRQPQPVLATSGLDGHSAPRYPNNIYYNASNWPDEINEYNTLYVAPGASLGQRRLPERDRPLRASLVGHHLPDHAGHRGLAPASESQIMLSHVLANNPRVGYAHQTDLIGPAQRQRPRTTATRCCPCSTTCSAQYNT